MREVTETNGEKLIRLSLLKPWVAHVEAMGIDAADAFSAHALRREDMSDPDIFVHAEVIYGLINNLAQLADDPYLGCHVGERFNLVEWPPLSKALEGDQTLGGFFTDWIAAVPKHASSVTHEMLIGARRAVYRTRRPAQPMNSPGQTDGFGFALILRVIDLCQDIARRPGDIHLGTLHPEVFPPAYKGAYVKRSELYGLEVSFPVGWIECEISTGLLEQPEMTINQGDNVSLKRAVRAAVKRLLVDKEVTLASVSRILGLDQRRLKHALAKLGTTVTEELRRVRLEEAKNDLAQTELSVGEIANRLGFSDPAHFSRFFRKQTGMTPSEYRSSNNP